MLELQSKTIIPSKLINSSFPFEDPVVVIQLKGKAIEEALENSVSAYPALEGELSLHYRACI